MPCVPIPPLPIPPIPDGLTFAAPIPAIPTVNVQAPCCTLPEIPKPKIPIPVGLLTLNPAVVAAIRAFIDVVENYAVSLPLDCPRSP
jgi:hypothetical protein